MSEAKKYEISEQTLSLIYNTLLAYSNRCTYEGERTGGVLQGCPRAPAPKPDNLIFPAQVALKQLENELPAHNMMSELEPLYTLKQAVDMIMDHKELYILRDRDRSEIVHPAYLDFTTKDEVLELLTPQ